MDEIAAITKTNGFLLHSASIFKTILDNCVILSFIIEQAPFPFHLNHQTEELPDPETDDMFHLSMQASITLNQMSFFMLEARIFFFSEGSENIEMQITLEHKSFQF